MAKRFIDTEIWKKSWFRKLPPALKLFIIYLFTNCDHAGLWDVDLDTARFFIGGEINLDKLPQGWYIELDKDKWFLPKFLSFQYPKGLNQKMKMHQSVLNILTKYKLDDYINTYSYENLTPSPRGNIPVQEKDKDMERDKDKEKNIDKNINKVTLPHNSDSFKSLWASWKRYKLKEFSFNYKSAESEQAAILQLNKLSGGEEGFASEIIKQSIANGWKGFFNINDQTKITTNEKFTNLAARYLS